MQNFLFHNGPFFSFKKASCINITTTSYEECSLLWKNHTLKDTSFDKIIVNNSPFTFTFYRNNSVVFVYSPRIDYLPCVNGDDSVFSFCCETCGNLKTKHDFTPYGKVCKILTSIPPTVTCFCCSLYTPRLS